MTLHRRAGEQEVDLIVIIPVASKVFNDAQAGLSVCNRGVEIVLLAVLVDAEAFKVNVSAGTELRLNRTGNVNGTLHVPLHDREFDRDDACHLNGTAERDLTIALREMQVTNGELCTLHMYRQIHLASARKVLDIAVATVLWPSRT